MLAPFGYAYSLGTARRLARGESYKPACPVICVGNINVGGTGKTPTVIALAERLGGYGVQVVSRGHGGTLTGPVLVDERRHSASEVGDEPLLLSAFTPVWVARDRADGVRAAEAAGAGAVLLDDGFQNPSVEKSLSIVVVDAVTGFGNGRVLPAGPLREPVGTGLARADLVLAIGDAEAQFDFHKLWRKSIHVPLITARLVPLETGMDWAGLRVLAFAGIGRPEKFFATLKGLGAEIAAVRALDDHQPLTDALMQRLESDAARLSAQLVTTEKDAVRLPKGLRQKVLTVPVRLEIDDPGPLETALTRIGLR